MTQLDALREEVCARLGAFRAAHVLSTEEEAVRIAEVLLPDKVEQVRISALLHDITKEYSTEKQLQIFREFGIILDNVTMQSPKVFHAKTAALILPQEFPAFAAPEVLSAIEKHTTGSADMSIMDCILYLADYIEPSRKYEDCKILRSYFWGGLCNPLSEKEKHLHLYTTMVYSFDLTINNLIQEHAVIASETIAARNAFVLKVITEKGEK